jgi:membrane fusion protein (multidrug efflux system)
MLLGLAVLMLGCKGGGGGWGGGGFTMPPMPVEIDVARSRPVADMFSTLGALEADEAVTIVAEIGGVLTSIPFSEGGSVAKGSLIAQIDDRELQADYDRTVALRDQSQTNFGRVKSVVDAGAGAPQDLDDASAAVKVAEANVSSAKARLDKASIRAPFSGLVGARRVSNGTYVRPGDAITDLARVEDLRVIFAVPERYLAQLKRGSEVIVTTTAFTGEELHGKIDVVEPMLDAATRSAKVVARVHNPNRNFRPGMSASVSAVLQQRGEALTISSEAVFVDQGQAFVYVIKTDSTVTRSALQLGTRLADAVEVTGGLNEGDRVVRTGHQKIFEGAKVIPVSSKDSTATPGGGH